MVQVTTNNKGQKIEDTLPIELNDTGNFLAQILADSTIDVTVATTYKKRHNEHHEGSKQRQE